MLPIARAHGSWFQKVHLPAALCPGSQWLVSEAHRSYILGFRYTIIFKCIAVDLFPPKLFMCCFVYKFIRFIDTRFSPRCNHLWDYRVYQFLLNIRVARIWFYQHFKPRTSFNCWKLVLYSRVNTECLADASEINWIREAITKLSSAFQISDHVDAHSGLHLRVPVECHKMRYQMTN